ncbi:MAG TPA: aldo/keto reductase [Mycobacteriales bacterium]
MSEHPTVTLNNGVEIPQLGYGVFQIPPDDVYDAVTTALRAGYRHIDTAAMYRNEEGVGRAIADSGLPRREIFVTTKLDNNAHGADAAPAALDASLRRLGLDEVDLYLIHWPRPKEDRYVETWQALEKAYADGKARAIGVSNFTEHHLRRLLAECTVTPALNQIELHPGFPQAEARAFHAEHQIATEAWSPLGQGPALLSSRVVTEMAERLGKDAGQVVLRWHLQLGNVVIPKSVTPERITSNIDVFDFELSPDDMAVLSSMSEPGRLGPDPDSFG